MQSKLEELLKALGLPVGLALVITSIAAYMGVPLEQAFQLFGLLTGLPFVIGLIVDVLKLVGVVTSGTSGVWSAGFNLLAIVGLAVLLKAVPDFDVTTWDAQLLELAKAVVLIITWIVQLFGTKRAHNFYTRGLGIERFAFDDYPGYLEERVGN
ncbi:MAG: hypothetical protein L0287_02915 [Anaerolineae bacterium]|nr:hypothetical protein [Anaerolineae bacterium]